MESLEAHPCSGDWSPRISFSYGFASKQRISSPGNSPVYDSDFEFSSFIGADLTPKWCMLSAEELFCDGKLRLFERSSEFGMAEGEWREENQASEYRGNVGRIGRGSETENVDSSERKLPTIRVGKMGGTGEEAVDNVKISRRCQRRADQADALRSLTNRGDLLSASCKLEKARSPTSRDDVVSVWKLERSEIAGKFKSPTSREDVVLIPKLERSKNAGNFKSPKSKEEVIYAEKLEMGAIKAGKLRSPTSREDLIPACKRDIGSKATKLRSLTSREELMTACRRFDNKLAEREGPRGEAGMPTNRERLKSADATSHKCKETRAPVRWRGEVSSSKNNEDDAHASQLRRFSRNPRSASMTVDGSSRLLSSTTCVSLNNSQCPSPSRSFSLPATTPTSPTASSSFSTFSSSSSSSRYRSRIKDFFKLKRLALKEAEPSSSRFPISPRSFFPFFKSKEASTNATPTMPHEQVSTSTTHVCGGAKKEQLITKSKGQVSSLDNYNAHIARPPPEQTICRADALTSSIERTAQNSAEPAIVGSRYRVRHSYSLPHEKLVLGKDGQVLYGVDEALWNKSNIAHTESPGTQSTHKGARLERGNMINMGNSGGGLVRHMERPISYTSSVRVTPVLNVPSCITPSLRKTKPLSKPKTFSFESLFARKGKTPVGYTIVAPTSAK